MHFPRYIILFYFLHVDNFLFICIYVALILLVVLVLSFPFWQLLFFSILFHNTERICIRKQAVNDLIFFFFFINLS